MIINEVLWILFTYSYFISWFNNIGYAQTSREIHEDNISLYYR